MNYFEILIFFISVIILSIDNTKLLLIIASFILFDIIRKIVDTKKKKNKRIQYTNNYLKHLNLKNNKKIAIKLLLLFFFGVIIVSINQSISLNYWKNATINNSLNSLILFIITILIFFLFATDSYYYDLYFFNQYFYPTKNEIIKNLFNEIGKINIKNLKLYSNFEIYRIFENL